jgi:hypothetical protein
LGDKVFFLSTNECHTVHKVPGSELEEVLAEFWEVLVEKDMLKKRTVEPW